MSGKFTLNGEINRCALRLSAEGSPGEDDAVLTTTPPPTPPPRPSATDAELSQLAQQLWDADINRFPDRQYTLHLQGHTNQTDTADRAPRR